MPAGGQRPGRNFGRAGRTESADKGHLERNHNGRLDQPPLPLFDGPLLGVVEPERNHKGCTGGAHSHERRVPQVPPGGARLEGFGRACNGPERRHGPVDDQQEPLGPVRVDVAVAPGAGHEGEVDGEQQSGHDGCGVVEAASRMRQHDPGCSVWLHPEVCAERRGRQRDGARGAVIGRSQIVLPDLRPVPEQGHGGLDRARKGVRLGRKVENNGAVDLDRVGRQGARDAGGVSNVGPDGSHRGQGVEPPAMDPQGAPDRGGHVRQGHGHLGHGDVVVVHLDDGGVDWHGGRVGPEAEIEERKSRNRERVQLHRAGLR